MLQPGLYEQIINKRLGEELDAAADKLQSVAPIDEAEAAKVLSQYISEVIEKSLDTVRDGGGDVQAQIELVNKI
ncbi:MAG: hypothetical protein AAGU32_18885, partial [Bacillota bacterium]